METSVAQMKVKEIMNTQRIVSVRPDDDVAFAGRMMTWAGVRHLPVIEKNQLVGIFTERDFLHYRADTGGEGQLDPVRAFMKGPVLTISPDDSGAAASALMLTNRIGCLPVVEGKRVVGIVTASDLLAAEVRAAAPAPSVDMPISRVMTPRPITVRENQPLVEAICLMADHHFRHVPVTDAHGTLVGMISDRDVRTAIGDPNEAIHSELTEVEALPISTVMTTPAASVRSDATLAVCARRLSTEAIGALVVVDHTNHVVGMLSCVDVMRALLDLAENSKNHRRPVALKA